MSGEQLNFRQLALQNLTLTMVFLHPLADFLSCDSPLLHSPPNYYYEGYCPQTGTLLRLPRTSLVEAIARNLTPIIQNISEGKMYGVLLVESPAGEQFVIKAFSGLLQGCSTVPGWVPPIPGRSQLAYLETETLAKLAAIKQEIITLKQLPIRQEYAILVDDFAQQDQMMGDRHRQDKQQRQEKRQQLGATLTGEVLTLALSQLEAESRLQGIERRNCKRRQKEVLQPLESIIFAANEQIKELTKQRRELSRQLQAQMHSVYSLTNFSGQSLSLQQLMPFGSPTGTGDCCAPKLLHYAATHKLKPLAMAEFWWGRPSVNQNKIPGEFYGACAERCQPLMGFLLSGLKPKTTQVPIIYEDQWLIVVNKPPGLLSVPGRYSDRQDSVLGRLGGEFLPVHRLDQETSGILILARDRSTHSQLSLQFQQKRVEKVYEALLAGVVNPEAGIIELPLWGNPENRPYQQVDILRGKPSVTRFRVMRREGNYTRMEFIPITGRTHQLRVHAADTRGLGVRILGDRLYGCDLGVSRLHLHAREVSFFHPHLGETLHLNRETPF